MSHLWVPTHAGEAVASLADALAAERREHRVTKLELAASRRAHRALCQAIHRSAVDADGDPYACARLVALWASELPEAFR